jgi:hypothetical protein
MVQTEISQLASEAADWHQILRNYREEIQDYKNTLQEICRTQLSKAQLLQVEHFANQFHIQLINVHDTKQEIKGHERLVQFEAANGEVSETTFQHHEELLDQFLTLESTLQELRNEFRNFVSVTSC